jgi:hypothetical protein
VKSEPKAFASLSSGLLARKGSARPAMRPQGFGQGGSGLEDLGWNDMGHDAARPSLVPVDGTEFGGHSEPQVSRTPLAGLTPISPVHHQHAEIEERFGQGDEDEESYEGQEQAYEAYSDTCEPEPEECEDTLELADELPQAMPAVTPEPVAVAQVVPLMPEPEELPEAVEEPAPRPAPKRSRAPQSQQSAKEKAAFTLRLDPSRHLKLRLACAVNAKSAQQLVTSALDKLLASMPELDAMASQAPEKASRKG